jgi:hypothetical protein
LQTDEFETPRLDHLRNKRRGVRRTDSGAAHARIDVDKHLEFLFGDLCRSVDPSRHIGIVADQDELAHAPVQRDDARDAGVAHHRRRQENRIDPGRCQCFGLAELGAADADRAAIDLPARDDRRLVCFRVRP